MEAGENRDGDETEDENTGNDKKYCVSPAIPSSSTATAASSADAKIIELERKLEASTSESVRLQTELSSASVEREELRVHLAALEVEAADYKDRLAEMDREQEPTSVEDSNSWGAFFGGTPTNSAPASPSRHLVDSDKENIKQLKEQIAALELDLQEAQKSARMEQMELAGRCQRLESQLSAANEELQVLTCVNEMD